MDRHRVGPYAVGIVRVVPYLGHLYGLDVWMVRVGNVVTLVRGLVAINHIFGNAVCNLLAGVELGKPREVPCPAVVLVHALAVYVGAVGLQTYADAFGPHAGSVVVIHPRLGAKDAYQIWLMPIYEAKPLLHVAVYLHPIAFHGDLLHAVPNAGSLHAILCLGVHGQLVEASRPTVALVKLQHLAFHGHGVLALPAHELHGNGFRTHAVAVVVVVPHLVDVYLRLARCVRIGNRVALLCAARNTGGVVVHGVFGHGVANLLAVSVLGHARKRVGPVIRLA